MNRFKTKCSLDDILIHGVFICERVDYHDHSDEDRMVYPTLSFDLEMLTKRLCHLGLNQTGSDICLCGLQDF
jgi:hypothetical protein